MEFMLIKKQKGYGCDYTIGCGMTYEIIELRAETIEEGLKKAEMKLAYSNGKPTRRDWKNEEVYFDLEDKYDLADAWIFPLESGRQINLDGIRQRHEEWIAKMEAQDARERAKAHEVHEAAEYERLKKKFEG